jgi:TorA maturation chaperone TorD
MSAAMIDPVCDHASLLARRICFRFIAAALADPRSGVWDELTDPATADLVAAAAEILREDNASVARPLALGERPLADLDPAKILARLPPTAGELNTIYESTFGLLGGSKCPPYETEYVPSKFTFQRSNMLADVAGYYRAFGLRTSSSNPDRPDHIAMECEFLAQLLELQMRASRAAAHEAADRSGICQAALERFLKEHVVWWFPAFGKLLARQDPGGFYEAVAHFLAALVAAERARTGIAPPQLEVQPSSIESRDECSGCELAAH